MNVSSGPGLIGALLGGLLLGLATPPAALPLGEWLVLPGLMIWYACATSARRPRLASYLLGCVHMAWFSWSVRHVMLGAYAAIVVVGGLYYLAASVATRRVPRRLAPLGFAGFVAASFWLRAVMPEIHYPHGQPCHALWQWPSLLLGVALGGEPIVNAALAGLAAAAVEVGRSWRVAVPPWSRAVAGLAAAVVTFAAIAVGGGLVRGGVDPADGERIEVVAVEPGFHPFDIWSVPREQQVRRYRELLRERLVEPTRRLLAAGVDEPDLVLWPESSLADEPSAERIEAGRIGGLNPWRLPGKVARLVVGANVRRSEGGSPAALLVELPTGRVLAYHDKQRLVPGGEFVPGLALLPDGAAAWLYGAFESALGTAPECVPGRPRPPMRTAAGTPFGALLCYDNAFPGPAREQVAAGARLLVVLSNEAWYRGGGELQQLVAMTVVRALETGTPFVRCTQDGWSAAVGADGRLLAALEPAAAPGGEARILRVSVPAGVGRELPMAWLRRMFGPLCALMLGLALAHALGRWVRLRTARSADPAAPGIGVSDPGAGGS